MFGANLAIFWLAMRREPITGRSMRALRAGFLLTLEAVADRIGISPQHLGRLERGITPLTPELARRIVEVIGELAHDRDVP